MKPIIKDIIVIVWLSEARPNFKCPIIVIVIAWFSEARPDSKCAGIV